MLSVIAPTATAASCGPTLRDTLGRYWHYGSFADLHAASDYIAAGPDGSDVALNFCEPALQQCLPAANASTVARGVAVRMWGPHPAAGARCTAPDDVVARTVPCTRACEVLGVGALGRSGGDWDFIDPATPRAGVRATHRAPRAAGEPASCGVDEYGNAQGVTLTVDVVCDAATRFEVLPPLLGAPPCHHALRLRTPKACFSFTWHVGPWGECEANVTAAGGAVRARTVVCSAPNTTAVLDEFCPAGRPADLTTCAAPPPGGGGAVVPVEPAADACAPNAWQILAALFSSLILCAIVLACCATAHPALSDVLPAAWTDAAADSGVDGALRGAADWINDRVPKRSAYRPPPRDDGVYREF